MSSSRRLDHIHGLRGIAALVVIFQHAAQLVSEAGHDLFDPLLHTINLGRFGVVLFFLVSGLVIPFSFRGETPLRTFALGRFFRLYPAYWLSVPVLALLAAGGGEAPGWGTVLVNTTMLQGFFGVWNIGPGYWTLFYEMIFYLLCAFLFWRGLLGDVVLNGIFVLTALLAAFSPFLSLLLTGAAGEVLEGPYFIAMFFLGMLLRRAFVDRMRVAAMWSVGLVPLAMVAGALLGGIVVPVPENANVWLSPLALATGMVLPLPLFVLVLWLKPRPPQAVMALGTISYSAYLFQDVGLRLLPGLVPPGQWPLAYVLAVIGLTLLVATLVYRFVERPMMALGRQIMQREGRSAAAGVTA